MSSESKKQHTRRKLRAPQLVLIVLAVIAAGLLTARLLGVRIFTVVSTSMEPAISMGDLAVVAPECFETIAPGEIITFSVDSSGHTATHRVFSKNAEEQTFVTKGNNNALPDETPVRFADVIGTVRWVIPGLGYVSIFLCTLQGKILLGLLFGIFVSTVLLVFVCRANRRKPL